MIGLLSRINTYVEARPRLRRTLLLAFILGTLAFIVFMEAHGVSPRRGWR